MEKAKKYVMSRLNSEDNFANGDPYFAIGAIIILGVLSLASLVANLFKKVKSALSGKKNRHEKITNTKAQVAHA